MIIGSGLVARAFSSRFGNDPDTLFFASGVSNSTETDVAAFQRERTLLHETRATHRGKLIYFSSCNVANPLQTSPYFEHKRNMERLVCGMEGIVLRLPQVVGHSRNSHTLTNFIHDHVRLGTEFTVWRRAQRNLIDIEDVVSIAAAMLARADTGNAVFSIASPHTLSMPDIVGLFERVLGKRAVVRFVDRGDAMHVDASTAIEAAASLDIDFGPDYPQRLITKYYGITHAS